MKAAMINRRSEEGRHSMKKIGASGVILARRRHKYKHLAKNLSRRSRLLAHGGSGSGKCGVA